MKRVIGGGILGGLVLFVWGAVAHMALPLGTAGLRVIPPSQEAAVLAAMQGAMSERALYMFPGMDPSRETTDEEQRAWMAKYAAGPAGIVAFNPHPAARVSGAAGWLFPSWFLTEFLGDILAALVAAFLVTHVPATAGYGKRVLLVGSLGLLMTLDIDLGYWNWYAFPTSYALAQLVDHTVGWSLVGLVLARICRGVQAP